MHEMVFESTFLQVEYRKGLKIYAIVPFFKGWDLYSRTLMFENLWYIDFC